MNYAGFVFAALLVVFSNSNAAQETEYLVKLKDTSRASIEQTLGVDVKFTRVSKAGKLFKFATDKEDLLNGLKRHDNVEYVQKNHPIRLFRNPSIDAKREALLKALEESGHREAFRATDNPAIKTPPAATTGADPLLGKSWGLANVAAKTAWSHTPQGKGIIVAVTDTGIDYNHEDLINNIWRNPNEIDGDNIDNDNNGYIDDVVGWDFAANDSKPFDLTVSLFEILLGGGNPGHGTHCAGVVGASAENGKGSAGVAPQAQLMALRFINEKGQGDTASAVGVVDYAVENGAHIISASWGSEGEDKGDKALREAVLRAKDAGVLFVAAAGNGRQGVGFDNDNDAKPMYPATYEYDNVITVAAMDSQDAIAKFSNWGKTSVDIGAPGVKILSTVPGDKYQDTVIDLGEFMTATWDGTSMATPHVSGALANVWSADTSLTWQEVKNEVLKQAKNVSALSGKVVTDGKLDLGYLANN